MQTSFIRYLFTNNDTLKKRIVILAVAHAHGIMNLVGAPNDPVIFKLKAKATELLNNPQSFEDRLMISVASLLDKKDLDSGINDEVLMPVIIDVFDALAGVTPSVED